VGSDEGYVTLPVIEIWFGTKEKYKSHELQIGGGCFTEANQKEGDYGEYGKNVGEKGKLANGTKYGRKGKKCWEGFIVVLSKNRPRLLEEKELPILFEGNLWGGYTRGSACKSELMCPSKCLNAIAKGYPNPNGK